MRAALALLGIALAGYLANEKTERRIGEDVWAVEYRTVAPSFWFQAYRKATCHLVRLAKKNEYSYFDVEDPWVEERLLPHSRSSTFTLKYRMSANVRFSHESVDNGLPGIKALSKGLMCGKWTMKYAKGDAEGIFLAKDAWRLPGQ